MYSRNSWGGPVDPFILVKFLNSSVSADDAIASLVVFEWSDRSFVGIPEDDGWGNVRRFIHNVLSFNSDIILATSNLPRRLRQAGPLQHNRHWRIHCS